MSDSFLQVPVLGIAWRRGMGRRYQVFYFLEVRVTRVVGVLYP